MFQLIFAALLSSIPSFHSCIVYFHFLSRLCSFFNIRTTHLETSLVCLKIIFTTEIASVLGHCFLCFSPKVFLFFLLFSNFQLHTYLSFLCRF